MTAVYAVVGMCTVLSLVILWIGWLMARKTRQRRPYTLPKIDEEYAKYYDDLRTIVQRLCQRTEDSVYLWVAGTRHSYYLEKGCGYTNLAVVKPPYSPNPADGVNNLLVDVKIYQIFANTQAPLCFIGYTQGLTHELEMLVFRPQWPPIELTARAARYIPGLGCAGEGELKALVDRLKHDEPLPAT